MVDFGSEQGLSNFETAGIAGYVEDFKRAKTPLWAKRCCLWMGTNYNGILLYSIMVAINRGSNIGSKDEIVGFDFHDGMVGFFCF